MQILQAYSNIINVMKMNVCNVSKQQYCVYSLKQYISKVQ